MTSYERNPSDAYRLPLPVDEPMAPEEALRRLRARHPVQLTGRPGDVTVLDSAALDDADAVVWRPEPQRLAALAALAEPWDFAPWRDVVGVRKFALDVPKDYERHTIQALSEAGFVLQRRTLLLESVEVPPDRVPARPRAQQP